MVSGRNLNALITAADPLEAHTISQRLRSLKKIPPELLPLGVVIGCVCPPESYDQCSPELSRFALAAAGFAMVRKLFTDKTLRLKKSEKKH